MVQAAVPVTPQSRHRRAREESKSKRAPLPAAGFSVTLGDAGPLGIKFRRLHPAGAAIDSMTPGLQAAASKKLHVGMRLVAVESGGKLQALQATLYEDVLALLRGAARPVTLSFTGRETKMSTIPDGILLRPGAAERDGATTVSIFRFLGAGAS